MPTIAALIPAYNEEGVIADALSSLAWQTRPPDQIIVVDDGSKDATAEIVKRWSRENCVRVDLVRRPNGGLPAARNTGFHAATTEYVALLDADDLWHPEHLATLEASIRVCREAPVLFGVAVVVNQAGQTLKRFPGDRIDGAWRQTGRAYVAEGAALYNSLVRGSYIGVSATMLSRKAGAAVGWMDERLRMIEDLDFWLRLSRKGPFVHVPVPIATKRVHDRNLTNPRNALPLVQYQMLVLANLLARKQELGLSREEEEATAAAFRELVPDLLYNASKRGVGAYCRAWSGALDRNCLSLALFNPRHLLRAVRGSVLPA